jgi:hypothetical protein
MCVSVRVHGRGMCSSVRVSGREQHAFVGLSEPPVAPEVRAV